MEKVREVEEEDVGRMRGPRSLRMKEGRRKMKRRMIWGRGGRGGDKELEEKKWSKIRLVEEVKDVVDEEE